MDTPWRIQLFGRLCIRQGEMEITRFRTQKTGALLAYLAYFAQTAHVRDVLIELLWPESELTAARTNLNVAIHSLRHQLEPHGVGPNTLLQADHAQVRLNPDAFTTDVADFQNALQSAREADNDEARIVQLTAAIELYRGELLYGHYEEWIEEERTRLADAYQGALRQLIGPLAKARDFDRALDYAHRAVKADPLREESYRTLMRLYAAMGRPAAVAEQFRALEQALKEGLNAAPSASARALLDELTQAPKQTPMTSEAPSPQAAPRPAPRLPMQFTRFFGREEEIAHLADMLAPGDLRLVTLIGPGGGGKTRLAIETARRLQETYSGAVWFAALADLSDPLLIPQALADALGLPRVSTADPLTRAIEFLSRQPSLLVLDNFEHLLHHEPLKNSGNGPTFEDGSALVKEMLTRVPALTCLVTSRLRLDLPGEREFSLAPLSVPEEGGNSDLTMLQTHASVQLFVDRAQALRPDFRITEHNAATIGTLCAKLEGMPLAIELAASRVGVMTIEQMMEQLEHQLDFLAGRQRGVEARHRSLRATIEWSYRLLSPEVQRFFARLSVFRGGWTAEAAEAVCGELPSPPDPLSHAVGEGEMAVWNVLAQLRDSSLILAEESGRTMRFRMLETLREFGQEQMSDEEREQVSRSHAEYFLLLAEEAEPHLYGAGQVEGLRRLEAERDNLRTALTWSLQESDPSATQLGLRLVSVLEWWWRLRGPWKEGLDFLQRLLARPEAQPPTPVRAKALYVAAVLSERYDRRQAGAYCEESLQIYREQGDPSGAARSLGHLGMLAKGQGDLARARAYFEEALALGREAGDQWAMADALTGLGNTVRNQGDFAVAKAFHEQGLAIGREMGNRWSISVALDCMGEVALKQSDPSVVKAFFEESLALKRELKDLLGTASAMSKLGWSIGALGDIAAAKALLDESLAIYMDSGELHGVADVLIELGKLAANKGDYEAVMAHGEQSLMIYQECGDVSRMAQILFYLGTWASVWGDEPGQTELRSIANASPLTQHNPDSPFQKIDPSLADSVGGGTETGSLAAIIQNFKTLSTRRINQARRSPGASVWQRGYYEHVLRDEKDMDRAREYIVLNPARWEEDACQPTDVNR